MTEELIKIIKGINDKVEYPLSNRVNLNLSKEQVDTIIFNLEKVADLEEKLANADYQLEGRENEIKDLVCEVGAKNEVIDKTKEIIRELLGCLQQDTNDPETNFWVVKYIEKAEAFLKE